MSAPEVDWVLDQLVTVVERVEQDYDTAVRLADRDESTIYELTDTGTTTVGDATVGTSDAGRTKTSELKIANYIGATFADRATEARGPGYHHNVEAVVGVRIEGLHHSKRGHIDPDGEAGVPFDELVRQCRQTLTDERNYPSVDSPDAEYYTLELANERPDSDGYADYYRYDFDVLLYGEQDL